MSARLFQFAVIFTLLAFLFAEKRILAGDAVSDLVCNRVRFYPRTGYSARMTGGKFQGSNTSPTSGFTDLATIRTAPPEGKWSELCFDNRTVYRYLRYLAPAGSWGKYCRT